MRSLRTPPPRLGFYFACLVTVVMGVLAVLKGHVHWEIFSRSTRAFLAGQNPYGVPLDPTHPLQTLWLYSPSAVLVFAPFVSLPAWLGKAAFLGVSGGVFLTGMVRCLGRFRAEKWGPTLLFLIVSSELIGSVQAYKLELLTAGFWLWAFSWLDERRVGLAFAALAFSASWKFQGLPVLGLCLLELFCRGPARAWGKALAVASGVLLAGLAWPYAFFGATHVTALLDAWRVSLSGSLTQSWNQYESLFGFTSRHFGWPPSFEAMRLVGTIGAVLAAAIVAFAKKTRERLPPYGLALALGSGYAVVLSPMSQSSGFILGTPLLLVAFLLRDRSLGAMFKVWTAILVAHWFLTSLLYSDLVPPSWRDAAWSYNVKPLGFSLLLVSVLLLHPWREVRRRPLTGVPIAHAE